MYYIVEIAGQQFKVKQGESKYVPHIEGKVGDTLQAGKVLLCFDDEKIISTESAKTLTLKIEKQIKGDKVIAFKMKRRKGFRKKLGHRTHYTKIKIDTIA